MTEIEDINKHVEQLCNDYGLYIESASEKGFRIFTDNLSGITLFLEIEPPYGLSFYFLQRTHDVVYHGDRSDVHVV